MSRAPKNRHTYRDAVLSEHGPPSATARLVALALTMRMDAKTLESFASAELLAILTGLTERTVRTALAALKAEGWIEERDKRRGRDFWLKYRRATFPDRLPEESAGSQANGHPAVIAGSRLPENGAGLPANGARLPADSDSTPCKTLRRHPAAIAADPDQEILKKDPEQDPGADPGAAPPSPANAGSAAREPERWSDEALRAQVQRWRTPPFCWSDERLLKKFAQHGLTQVHLAVAAGGGA